MSAHNVEVRPGLDIDAFIREMVHAEHALLRLIVVMAAAHRRSHPRPLCIEGHAYARRRRARRR